MDNISTFISSIKKVNNPRIHKVNGSLGVYDGYKWIRKNHWLNIGRALTEHEFYSIIRKVNEHLVESLLLGNDIKFPYRMGTLEVRKTDAKYKLIDGRVETNLPIDWDRTLRLWHEDEDSYNNKILVRLEGSEIFNVIYNKHNAVYNNKSFYDFKVNRRLKQKLKQQIKEGNLDAFKL